MKIDKWVLNPGEFKGSAYTWLENGECPYTHKTESEFLVEGYKIVSDVEFDTILKTWEKSLCGHWEEITEEKYNDMLDVLPPVKWYNGGFYMSERYTGNVSGFYQRLNGKYYTSLQNLFTPRAEILDDLQKWVAENIEMSAE